MSLDKIKKYIKSLIDTEEYKNKKVEIIPIEKFKLPSHELREPYHISIHHPDGLFCGTNIISNKIDIVNEENSLAFLEDCKVLSIDELSYKYEFISDYDSKYNMISLVCAVLKLNPDDYMKKKNNSPLVTKNILDDEEIAIKFMDDFKVMTRAEICEKYNISNTTMYRLRDRIMDKYNLTI